MEVFWAIFLWGLFFGLCFGVWVVFVGLLVVVVEVAIFRGNCLVWFAGLLLRIGGVMLEIIPGKEAAKQVGGILV